MKSDARCRVSWKLKRSQVHTTENVTTWKGSIHMCHGGRQRTQKLPHSARDAVPPCFGQPAQQRVFCFVHLPVTYSGDDFDQARQLASGNNPCRCFPNETALIWP